MNKELEQLITIRDYVEGDKSFVISTMLRGLYYGETVFSDVPKDIFMVNYKHVVEAIIKKHTVQVACLRDDPDTIVGYSILSLDFQTIHWVYVKKAWRNKGIAKALVPKLATAVTHLSALGKTLLPKLKDCIFNPFAI